MKRIPFSQIIIDSHIDINKEYERLYHLFYKDSFVCRVMRMTLSDLCDSFFLNFPFRGTCLSLDDYCETHGICFEEYPNKFDMDYLVSFCEFTYNFVSFSSGYVNKFDDQSTMERIRFYIQQVLKVMESIGYIPNSCNGVTDFVQKNPASISVAEIVEPALSYKAIEYNHYSMKGDLERKRDILFQLGEQLTPRRKKLSEIASALEKNVFFMLNNLNIRHNNIDKKAGSDYHPTIAEMSKEDLEFYYDELYQMILLSFLELDNSERVPKITELKKAIAEEKR